MRALQRFSRRFEISTNSDKYRAVMWLFRSRRQYLLCTRCRCTFYLTPIEVRFHDERKLIPKNLCRSCLAREREEAEFQRPRVSNA